MVHEVVKVCDDRDDELAVECHPQQTMRAHARSSLQNWGTETRHRRRDAGHATQPRQFRQGAPLDHPREPMLDHAWEATLNHIILLFFTREPLLIGT